MTRLFPLLLLGACVTELPDVADPCAAWKEPGLYTFHVDVNGKKRQAYVFVPADSVGPRDLVVALHGAGSDPRTTSEVTGYLALAKQQGFVAAFPSGTDPLFGYSAWNAGRCCLGAAEDERDEDDLAFLDALTVELEARACTDRVLATGFSNGSMMAHRWACNSDKVDVVVPIGGTPLEATCAGPPMPVRHYHGTGDPLVPIQGSDPDGLPPLADAMEIWLDRNQCDGSPPELETSGIMTCQRYTCAAPTEVCLLEGWKHQWPGGKLTSQTGGIDATKQSWEFFLAYAPPREATANPTRSAR